MLWPDNLILFFWRGLHSAYMGCVPAYWSADPSRPIRRRRDERGYYIKRIFIYQVDRYRLQGPVIMLRRAFSLFLFFFLMRTDCDVTVHSKQTPKKKYIRRWNVCWTSTDWIIIWEEGVFLFFLFRRVLDVTTTSRRYQPLDCCRSVLTS